MSVPVDEVLLEAIDTVTYELAGLAERIRAAKVNDKPVPHPIKPAPKPKPKPPKPKDQLSETRTPDLAERVEVLEAGLAWVLGTLDDLATAEAIIRRAKAWPTPIGGSNGSVTTPGRLSVVKNPPKGQ